MKLLRTMAAVGWLGLGGLVLVAIFAPTHRALFLSLVVSWILVCWSYILTVRSKLSFWHLLKNALIVSLVAGAWIFFTHGEPRYDDDDQVVEEGFEVSTADRALAADRTFGRFAIITFVGVTVGLLVRRRGTDQLARRDHSRSSPFEHTYDHGESGL